MIEQERKSNIVDLAEELKITKTSVVDEEQEYLDSNLAVFEQELIEAKEPYPDITPFTTGDYQDLVDIQWKKGKNKPYWEKQEAIQLYYDADPLYVGHLQIDGDPDYFITESLNLETRDLGETARLISFYDKRFEDIRRVWRYPKDKPGVIFSRNILIKEKKVILHILFY